MHKHRTTLIAGATLAAALALPAVASAHHATIACDQARPGQYLVQPDYLHLNPVTTFGPDGAVVRWRDGYTVRLAYPAGCVPVVPPVTPPAPPESQPPPAETYTPSPQAPETYIPPPVITPARPEPTPRVVPRKPRKVTCAWLRAHGAGKISYLRRGFYPGCRVPVARKVPRPGVTG